MSVNPVVAEKDLNADAFDSNPATNPTATTQVVSGVDADREVSAGDDAPDGSKHVERDFYNPFDGLHGRTGGVYLDVKERVDAEAQRALSEKRKPDLKNPPAVAGTPLVTEESRVDNRFANPSSLAVAPVKDVDPVSTLPVDVGIASATEDTTYADQLERENQVREGATDTSTSGTATEDDQTKTSESTTTTNL